MANRITAKVIRNVTEGTHYINARTGSTPFAVHYYPSQNKLSVFIKEDDTVSTLEQHSIFIGAVGNLTGETLLGGWANGLEHYFAYWQNSDTTATTTTTSGTTGVSFTEDPAGTQHLNGGAVNGDISWAFNDTTGILTITCTSNSSGEWFFYRVEHHNSSDVLQDETAGEFDSYTQGLANADALPDWHRRINTDDGNEPITITHDLSGVTFTEGDYITIRADLGGLSLTPDSGNKHSTLKLTYPITPPV